MIFLKKSIFGIMILFFIFSCTKKIHTNEKDIGKPDDAIDIDDSNGAGGLLGRSPSMTDSGGISPSQPEESDADAEEGNAEDEQSGTEAEERCHCQSPISDEAMVVVKDSSLFKSRVEPEIFGSFQEHHWGDIVSGIYEQYLINPSFKENWFKKPSANKTRIVFANIPKQTGLAYPWNRVTDGRNVNYRVSNITSVNGSSSQEIVLASDNSKGGVLQKLALPDQRVLHYDAKLWVRTTGDVSVYLAFIEGDSSQVLRKYQVAIPKNRSWIKIEQDMKMPVVQKLRHQVKFGVVKFSILATGKGSVFVDQVTLIPSDAIEGKFNPTTIDNLKAFGQTMIRWPGGNFTSGYRWKDGVGRLKYRASRDNLVWGGLDANHFGTDEFLRFCEITGITPLISAGFNEKEIATQELADWVEYVNGDESTPMGRLRAQNGHVKPYKVKFWSVGNETYGSYQIGNTDVDTYSRGLIQRVEAMKAIDPSISVAAVGYGLHNTYREPASQWTQSLLGSAGNQFDTLDVHAYIYGPKIRPSGIGPNELNRGLLASSRTFQEYYDYYRNISQKELDGRVLPLVHYEWATLPHENSDRRGARQTWLNGVIVATYYNVFLRNSDMVKGAAFHNFSLYFNPVSAHSEAVNPRSYVSALYSELANGRVLKTRTYNIPSYNMESEIQGVGKYTNVKEVDTIAASGKDGKMRLYLVNRHLTSVRKVNTCFDNSKLIHYAKMRTISSEDPYQVHDWSSIQNKLRIKESKIKYSGCHRKVDLPPLSVTQILRE